MNRSTKLTTATAITACLAMTAQADVTATLSSQDQITGWKQSAPKSNTQVAGQYNLDAASGRVGVGGSFNSGTRTVDHPIFGFTLPTLDGAIIGVSITFTVRESKDDNNPVDTTNGQVDVYLLNDADPSDDGLDFFYMGANGDEADADTDYVGGFNPVGTGTISETTTINLTGAALTNFIALYTGLNPNQTEVFFRLNHDDPDFTTNTTDRFVIDLGSDPSKDPFVTITTIPEPASLALMGLGSLLILGRRRVA